MRCSRRLRGWSTDSCRIQLMCHLLILLSFQNVCLCMCVCVCRCGRAHTHVTIFPPLEWQGPWKQGACLAHPRLLWTRACHRVNTHKYLLHERTDVHYPQSVESQGGGQQKVQRHPQQRLSLPHSHFFPGPQTCQGWDIIWHRPY